MDSLVPIMLEKNLISSSYSNWFQSYGTLKKFWQPFCFLADRGLKTQNSAWQQAFLKSAGLKPLGSTCCQKLTLNALTSHFFRFWNQTIVTEACPYHGSYPCRVGHISLIRTLRECSLFMAVGGWWFGKKRYNTFIHLESFICHYRKDILLVLIRV